MAAFVAWEAVTSLGESAAETALMLRAGLNNVAPSRFIDAKGQRVMMCWAPAVQPDILGIERAAALSHLALARLEEAIEFSRPATLLLALPERYASHETNFKLETEGLKFLKVLRAGLPQSLESIDIEVFPFGRAAGVLALPRALELVDEGKVVIWGGVDTFYDWTMLEALERANRLLNVDNVDGVRPGEGAAFIVLGPADAPDAIRLLGFGTGREPNPVGSEESCRSAGLTAALESALAPLRAASVRTNCWLLDNSHEAYATHELQNVIARFGDVLGLSGELQMPLQELGDVGAAAMPLLAVLGAEAWRLGYANDDLAIVTGCSQGGVRGALLLGANDSFRQVERVA
jgi:hypothetical protein